MGNAQMKARSDTETVKLYKRYVGTDFNTIQTNFAKIDFSGDWYQVMTSRSTGLFGTGIDYSSVKANYSTGADPNIINVINSSYDANFNQKSIFGISRARDNTIPTCRTVKFDVNPIEGDYWIIYVSDDGNTVVVSAPLIIPGIPLLLSNNFGVYVLTRDISNFWVESNAKTVLAFLRRKGFTQIWNKPVNSSKSLEYLNIR